MPAKLSRKPFKLPTQGDDWSGAIQEGLEEELKKSAAPLVVLGEQRYVLYMDILGFRQLAAQDEGGLYQKYKSALEVAKTAVLSRGIQIRHEGEKTIAEVVGFYSLSPPIVFSDSVFIASRDYSLQSLADISILANALFRYFLAKGLPVKGAIAQGRLHWDSESAVYLGEAIVRAYELAESIDAIGVAIHPAIQETEPFGGPVDFPVKGGSHLSLMIPEMGEHPMGFHGEKGRSELLPIACNESFVRLRKEARSSGNLRAIAKLDASAEIVQKMLETPARKL